MADDREKLRSTIDQLHAELAAMDEVDEEVRSLLNSAVTDIHTALEKDDIPAAGQADEPEDASIVGRLSEAARHYEDSHPTLSGILGSIIDTLSRMGI
jgi:hypothetical protein